MAGYNAGYQYGFGSMLVAHLFMTLVVITLSCMLMELASAFPFASGCATYATAAFGSVAACVMGYSYTLELLFQGSQATQFVGVTFETMFSSTPNVSPLYWAVTLTICFCLNLRPKLALEVLAVCCGISILCYFVCVFMVMTHANLPLQLAIFSNTTTSNLSPSSLFPLGALGVIKSYPYALYLLICFEVLPCIAEETKEVGIHLHRGMSIAVGMLITMSWISLILTPALPAGVSLVQSAAFPFSEMMSSVYPMSHPQAITVLSFPAMFSSQLGIFFACTRFIYGLSRGGFFPTAWSLTTSRGAPYIAMIMVTVTQFILCVAIKFSGLDSSQAYVSYKKEGCGGFGIYKFAQPSLFCQHRFSCSLEISVRAFRISLSPSCTWKFDFPCQHYHGLLNRHLD